MSEVWVPCVISFNPHIPLKTISMFFPPMLYMWLPQVAQWWGIHLSMQETQEMWVQSLGWEIPWRREWLPTPVFLPGKFQGQRSLGSSSLWSGKELDMAEWLTQTHRHTDTHTDTHTHTVPGCILFLYYPWGEWGQETHPGQMILRYWYGMQIQFLWF